MPHWGATTGFGERQEERSLDRSGLGQSPGRLPGYSRGRRWGRQGGPEGSRWRSSLRCWFKDEAGESDPPPAARNPAREPAVWTGLGPRLVLAPSPVCNLSRPLSSLPHPGSRPSLFPLPGPRSPGPWGQRRQELEPRAPGRGGSAKPDTWCPRQSGGGSGNPDKPRSRPAPGRPPTLSLPGTFPRFLPGKAISAAHPNRPRAPPLHPIGPPSDQAPPLPIGLSDP